MQDNLISKEADERLLAKDQVISTTLFSNNPFESTQDMEIEGEFNTLGKDAHLLEMLAEPGNHAKRFNMDRLQSAFKSVKKNPGNPHLINNLGLVYLNNKEIKKAKKCFLRALEFDNDLRTANLNLASLYKLSGEFNKAIEIYNKLLDRNPNDKGVKINLANLYLHNLKFDKVEKILSEVWESTKVDTDVANKLAIIFLINRKSQKSISLLRQGLRVDPNNPTLYNSLGVAYAASHLNKKAILAFKSAINISPSYRYAQINLAKILVQEGKLGEAIDGLENYLSLQFTVVAAELLAKYNLLNRDYNRSINLLRRALTSIKTTPNNNHEVARIFNNMGVVYHNMRDYEKAENFYSQSIEIEQYESVVPITNIIDLYFDKNNITMAKAYIDLLREKFPNAKIYLFYEAVYDYNKNNITDATDKLISYLEYDKQLPAAYSFLSYIYAEYLFDFAKSINILLEGMKYLPKNKLLINNLAYNYLMLDNVEEARKLLSSVDDKSNVYLTATRGLLAIKEGNIEEGRRLYNSAANLAHDRYLKNLVYQKKDFELAKFYLKINSLEKAKECLERIIGSQSSNSIYKIQATKLFDSFS